MPDKHLTPKQKRFIDFYILSGNASEAAIQAGYSKKAARFIGSENLTKPYIRKYYQDRIDKLDAATMMQQKEVLQRLTKIGRREEMETIVITVSHKVERWENVGTIEKPVYKKTTDTVDEPRAVEIPSKLSDAIRAMELIGKHLKMFTERFETDMRVTGLNELASILDVLSGPPDESIPEV